MNESLTDEEINYIREVISEDVAKKLTDCEKKEYFSDADAVQDFRKFLRARKFYKSIMSKIE